MAGKSTISITFKIDGDSKEFKDLIKNAEGLRSAMTAVVEPAEQLKKRLINFAALATGFKAVQDSVGQLQGMMKGMADVYAEQEVNDRKLETTMRNSMGATDGQVKKIKDLCAAQEQQGVVSASVQTAAAQELATYLGLSSSLETLIPVLNDMAAQQYGVNASAESATTIATMLGKVMNGQVSALSRYGYTFDEVQEKILKFGTEEERAAVLAEVVGASVGGMNAQLAQTDSGRQKQLADRIDAVKASIGQLANTAMPFVTMASEATTALTSIGTLASGIKTLTVTLYAGVKGLAASTAAFFKERLAVLASAAAKKTAAAASAAWTAVQKVLNLVLTANPIGLIITAIGALVAAVISAYKNCEGFREIVDKVWEAIKPLANAIVNGLAKAFEWLVEKCREAWEWLKNILGLSGKKVKIDVEVSTSAKTGTSPDMDALYNKYKDYDPDDGSTPKAAGDNTPLWRNDASTLKGITDNIQILNEKLQAASLEEAALINQQIAAWNKKADAIRNAGKAVDNTSLLKEDASTLREINDNITILTEKLQDATADEAVMLNQQIDAWNEKADAIRNAGKAAEDNTPLWKEDAGTLREINDNITILTEKLQDATADEAVMLNQQIAAWNKKADAIKNAGIAVDNTPLWKEDASTLQDINSNIQILNDQLQTATVSEAALINRQIDAWNEKADAIRNAGKEAEKVSVSTGKALQQGWGGIRSIGSSIEDMTDALQGNGNAWQIVTGIIDGFISLYSGIQAVAGIIQLLTGASTAHAATKGVEATAETTEAAARATSATTNAAASAAIITANKLEAASWKELAASEYMAAHAYIPFAGFGIGAGFVASMLAVVAAAGVPMLAEGGIASGPTLAMVGEYAGAKGNPEVIAPLDKLRGMLAQPASMDFGRVEFEIKGRTLVGILNKENNITKRS